MRKTILLDQKDRRLLFELDFHARRNLKNLAKRVGISARDAEKRLYRLIQRGVIKGFHPVLNVPKLGYVYCRIVVTLQNCRKENEEDIVDYLVNHPNIFWCFRLQGPYDFLIVMWAESLAQFTDFVEDFENKFGKFIKRRLETVVTHLTYFQARYLVGTPKTEELHVQETRERISIDELDKRMLQLLSINARFTLTELAMNLHAPEEDIAKRIRRLERVGFIEGYRPLIDHTLLGYTWYKVWLNINKTSQKAFQQLAAYIKESPVTLWTIEGIGLPADLEIEVMVESNQELFDFINGMRQRFPTMIEEYTTFMFVETIKELYLPFY